MEKLRISDAIKTLEELKENYGDVRIVIPIPYEIDTYEFVEKIEIDEVNNEVVAVIW